MKILMATMGLDIGGAETHIVELAKELKKEGHDVCVAAHGGVYVPELEAAGIRHYPVPMHRRDLRCMTESYFLLRKIIREEKPDIVHAHARIPAFLCHLLRLTMRFPFVTTAHWVFDTGGILKYVTNWGQKTVAVSEDIKEYLITNYGVPEGDIFVTVNGIDTEKFSPQVSGSRIWAEFSLDPEKPILSYVSRMDDSRALVARQLIDIAPELDRRVPGIQLLLAGGGNVLEELKARAVQVNAQLGRTCVVMAGPRTDINEIVAAGQVFVGVSRAALEAMAAAKPVLVAGNEGYLGLFTAGKLQEAMENNFCCRGCPMSTEERLLEDVSGLFALSLEEREKLGAYGREMVQEFYSVRRMAQDCMKAYRAALPPAYQVVMCGYYGFANAGDEAILQAIHRDIDALGENIGITVLSNDPEDTRRRYGYEAVYRFHLWKVLRTLRRCDLLLFGGGSLLQDRTSTRSLVYYVTIIRLAERMGKKVMFYANGIGPVDRPANRRRVCRAAMGAQCLTLRDQNSAQELREMGVDRPDLFVTADPVFTLDGVPPEDAWEILRRAGVPKDRPFLAVSIRSWDGMDRMIRPLARSLDRLARQGYSVVFVVMQYPNDVAISRQVRDLMEQPAWLLDQRCSPKELMGIIGLAELVISMRLHTLIFSARMGVPLVGLIYDPKVAYYLELLEMPSGGEVTDFQEEEFLRQVEGMLTHRAEYAAALQEKEARLEQAAHENEHYLLELLKKPADKKERRGTR